MTIITFDLSWSGAIGWAALKQGRPPLTGAIELLHEKEKKDSEEVNYVKKSAAVYTAVMKVLNEHGAEESRLTIGYEDTTWALQGRRQTPQKIGAISPITCCWLATGHWASRNRGVGVELYSVKIKDARKAMGVDKWARLRTDLRQIIERQPHFDKKKIKVDVGVAVACLMEQNGYGTRILPTDHEADALLYALYLSGLLSK